MNFERGQRYRVGNGVADANERGNVIVITMVMKEVGTGNVWVHYKTVASKNAAYVTSRFTPGSNFAKSLIPLSNNKIIITTDGTTTMAKMYDGKQVVKTATAKCNPDDEFDFKKGAVIAFDRLVKEEPKKPNFKVGDFVRIKGVTHLHYFPIGTIVEVKRIDNDGDLICYGCRDFTNGCKSFGIQIVSTYDVEVAE